MRRRTLVWSGIVGLASVLAGCGTADAPRAGPGATTSTTVASSTTVTGTNAAPDECVATAEATLDVAYDEIEGVDPNLLSLDVYPAAGAACGSAPVVVYVHGGGWRTGDKAMRGAMDQKRALAEDEGWVLVSVNYRLTDVTADDPVRYPSHPTDVGRAVAWVQREIEPFGGDPDRVVLLGHSAGAGIVSQLGAEPSFVTEAGGAPVRCVISLDTEAYDIVRTIETGGPRTQSVYGDAFGDDPDVWAEASPIEQLDDGDPVPEYLLVVRGLPDRIDATADFAASVEDAGGTAEVIDASPYSHADVNRRIGEDGEEVVTPAVVELVDRCAT